jgi:hypothetical protein
MREYLALPVAELLQRVVTAPGRDQLLDQGGVHDRAARGDPADRVCELGHVGHPALEQVADPVTGGEQLHRLLDLGVRRQDQDPGPRELPADLAGRVEALGQVVRGHPDVDDGEIRLVLADQGQQPGRVVRLTDHLEPRPFK